MKTLEILATSDISIPPHIVWMLELIAEYKGKQKLFEHQSPELLQQLRETSVIESSVSSTRIEGVTIDKRRVGTVLFGEGELQDSNEAELRGYQDALSWVHREHSRIPITVSTMLTLHKMIKPTAWDRGQLKQKDGEIIERLPSGDVIVRFRPTSARETPAQLTALCKLFNTLSTQNTVSPLVLLAAFNLDFLSIHPFRDGNGRVSRVLILLMLYQFGYTVGRYVSVERIIEQHKEEYYRTLKQSSDGWHTGKHDFWEFVAYLLSTIKAMYREFESRVVLTNTVVKEAGSEKSSEKSSEKIVSALSVNPKMTIAQLADMLGISTRAVEKQLHYLKKQGRVRRVGGRKEGHWETK